MNLQELRYFAAVVEYRHFGRAAEACNVSQPTLSSQLRKLEDELGVTLLERTNKRVDLTPVGCQILEHAQRALAETAQIESVARAARDPLVGALRRGEVVAMLGDRAYGSPSAKIPFCGGTAAFPIGAYVMASIAGAALMHVFSLREPGGRYRFFGFPPQHPQMPAHNERDTYLKKCAANFAGDLESVLKRDPFQWYNFFPFWEKDESLASAPVKPKPVLCPSR